MNRLQDALTKNGYKKKHRDKTLKNKRLAPKTRKNQDNNSKVVPYVRGTTDKIAKIFKRHNIETIFTTDRKVKDLLSASRERIPLENQGVYNIPCGECSSSYVGQTNRKISIRRDEHINAVKQKIPFSALAQRWLDTGHKINFSGTKMLM